MKTDFVSIAWSAGTAVKATPEAAHKQFEVLRKKNDGELRREDIVEAARSSRNPLHKEFEWDDKVAAHEQRLDRAGYLIRHLRVVHRKAPKIPVRPYESVRNPAETPEERPRHIFRSTEEILKDPDMRDELLSRAIRDAMAFTRRYRGLRELAGVINAFEEFLLQHEA